jgi:riboflavin biosynthesis pyrimidine reductase
VRRLLPTAIAVDLADPYAPLSMPGTAWLALGMVTSLDGAVAIADRSGGLGGAGDRAGFRAVRALGDVILVGARTVVTESYGATWPARHAARRTANDQHPLPTLVIVSASGTLPPDARVLRGDRRPVLLTTPDGARAAARLALNVDVVETDALPTGGCDLVVGLERVRGLLGPRIVCEGGPTLNASLLRAGLVDELFVTVSPQLVGAAGSGLGGTLPPDMPPVALTLHELRVHGSELLCRYRVHGHRYGSQTAEQG